MQTDEKDSLREFWKGTIQANKCGLYCFSEASKAEEACELFRENIPAGWWCSVIREKELNVYRVGTLEQFDTEEAENIEKARRERAIRDRELFGGRARSYLYWRNSKKRSGKSSNKVQRVTGKVKPSGYERAVSGGTAGQRRRIGGEESGAGRKDDSSRRRRNKSAHG